SLSSLRQRGISIAIDDFGTGYSSLSYLGRLPANRLKIDRSFILAISGDNTDVNIPEMVTRLGRQLNMKVIAEGVETGQQLNLLKAMGCDEIQGYLYARPMLFDELLTWLDQRKP
ncbi:MAG: putative signaling protein, partial [Proteobacteria bacterium]|nr:putative signaling protein [Pseudomonadota bacterium]